MMQTPQDTGKFRTNEKDQFYTNPQVAKKCIDSILSMTPNAAEYLWIEPSAGDGAFLHTIPTDFRKIGIDIDPHADDIIRQDYLAWSPPKISQKIIVFGNPPFGRQSSLAKSFIARSCQFADIIAFILPKSFTKPSMYRAFAPQYHLIHSADLEKKSFLLNKEPYDVPCVFQIWKKMPAPRNEDPPIVEIGFKYVKFDQDYDIAFRRVGGLAGKCYKKNATEFSVQSHYFIQFAEYAKPVLDTIIDGINLHVFPSNTVGPRSLSKSEINKVINHMIEISTKRAKLDWIQDSAS